ncbi:MAG: hypothetical protein A2W91_13295 [Bacteroidetes bacterium GWF2_38_335]|nr:MAG: hypothetical protein A2W91_13295 [Bacteroidetes bacterium GWF2_38_335]OFY77230.1 MAG: hypothetical protein A2281_14960 [Bacteroidetes bacterium RIFOXYA12_FULL_38_20]HBS85769.1 hypothetical protein [Bacteroidales bacterium]
MKTTISFNEKELEIFSDELLDDFQMMETYAGSNNSDCTNTCETYNGVCIKLFCGDDCKVKGWLGCTTVPDPTK